MFLRVLFICIILRRKTATSPFVNFSTKIHEKCGLIKTKKNIDYDFVWTFAIFDNFQVFYTYVHPSSAKTLMR